MTGWKNLRHIIVIVLLLGALPAQATMYENSEDGDTSGNVPPNVRGWFVYDPTPANAQIQNVADAQKGGRVIQFNGGGANNGYMLGDWYPWSAGSWNNTSEFNINWCSKYSSSYVMYMRVYTAQDLIYTDANGILRNDGKQRYIYYTAVDTDYGNHSGQSRYIHHGLGTNTRDGTWHSLSRNLLADLREYEPTNSITSVTAFLIRGSGRVDDIELSTNPLSPIVSLKKTSRTVHDPVNGLNQPKAIPGATLEYTITAKNTSRGAADAGSTVITDKVPPNMKLCVSNVAPCTAPRLNTVNNSSGLTLASVKYSSNHGADNYGYTPVPDVSGHDSNVTDVKYEFNQRFLGSCGPSIDRHFELKMRMALK